MLAEPRYKQKWAADPRNTQWSEDKTKFGYQLMSKMGWSEGKGLGADESGVTSHVKVKKRKENLGLGSTTNHSENWIAHQDDFNALLANLNKKNLEKTDDEEKGEENERSSLKHSVKQSRKKIFYSKFIHSKDLSLKSKNDLACVMGQRSKSTPATPQELSEDEGAKSDTSTASCPVGDVNESSGFVTKNSEMNLQEYFAQKMASLKNKKAIKDTNDYVNGDVDKCDPEPIREIDSSNSLKKKKKRKDKKDTQEAEEIVKFVVGRDDVGLEDLTQKTESKKKKKSKKSKTKDEQNGCSENSNDVERTEGDKGKVKKSKNSKNSIEEESVENQEEKLKSKKKKKKKRKYNEIEDETEMLNLNSGCHDVKKVKKSKS